MFSETDYTNFLVLRYVMEEFHFSQEESRNIYIFSETSKRTFLFYAAYRRTFIFLRNLLENFPGF
jgi:hypothetical protein